MKLFTLVTLSLAALSAASPVPDLAPAEDLEVRAATPEEVRSVFGYDNFDDFLASRKSKRNDSPSSIFKRATVSICQQNSVRRTDAHKAIDILAGLSSSTKCGNNQNPPTCSIMRTSGTARLGFCGPRATSIYCNKVVPYLRGIADTCQYAGFGATWEDYTGGYQALNENTQNYVFID